MSGNSPALGSAGRWMCRETRGSEGGGEGSAGPGDGGMGEPRRGVLGGGHVPGEGAPGERASPHRADETPPLFPSAAPPEAEGWEEGAKEEQQ